MNDDKLTDHLLRQFGLEEQGADPEIDRITRMAARLFRVGLAAVVFKSGGRHWLKSVHGDAGIQPGLLDYTCDCAAFNAGRIVVAGPGCAGALPNCPLVKAMHPVGFYAGVPLRLSLGIPIGTLCIADAAERDFSPNDYQTLEDFGHLVVSALELQRRADMQRQFFQSSPVPVVLHYDNRILEMNAAAEALLGMPLEQARRVPLSDMVHPESWPAFKAAAEDLEASTVTDALLTPPGGPELYVECLSSLMVTHDRVATATMMRDHTARVLAEREVRLRTQQLELALQAARMGVWQRTFDPDALHWSDEVYALCGLDRRSFTPSLEGILGITHPDDVAGYLAGIRHAEATGASYKFESRILLPGGGVRWIETSGSLVHGEDGAPAYAIGVVTDVTWRHDAQAEREQLFRKLSAERKRLETIVHSSSAFMAILEGPERRFATANPAYERLFQRDVVGKTLEEAYPELKGDAHAALLESVYRTGERWSGAQVPIRFRPEESAPALYIDLVYQPLTDEEGKVSGLMIQGWDVTGQVEARERLEQALLEQQRILDRSNDLICTFGPDLRFQTANRAGFSILGYPPEELVGRSVITLVHPEDQEAVLARARDIVRARPDVTVETARFLRRTGETVYLEWSGVFIGETANIFAIGRDVTRQHLAEMELRRSAARWRSLIDAASDAILVSDLRDDLRFTEANQSACEMLGYTREELLALRPKDIAAIKPETDETHIIPKVEEMLVGGAARFEHTFYRKDGSAFVFDLTLTRISDELVLGVGRDNTARKRYEQELIAARDRAEELNRLKSAFLANMSHEIRTPLTAIIGFSEVLLEEIADESRALVELVMSGGRRLMETLNSVLDLAQLEGRSLRLHLDLVDVRQIVADVADLYRPRAEKKRLALTLEAPGPVMAELDAAALSRIASNLISNAVKFTRAGAVTVRVAREGAYAVLTVADTGVGIAPEFLPRLFNEFQQESTGMAREFEGSGLGLTITRRLVELMNGAITVESEKGQGATFTVRFLASDQALPEMDALGAAPSEDAPTAAAVLVVDDDPNARMLVRHMLEPQYTVLDCATLDAFRAAVAAHRFAVVLVDINLGGDVTGAHILAALRADPRHAAAPVLAFTANALPGDEQRFRDAGFDGYLSKPFTREQLARAVGQALSAAP